MALWKWLTMNTAEIAADLNVGQVFCITDKMSLRLQYVLSVIVAVSVAVIMYLIRLFSSDQHLDYVGFSRPLVVIALSKRNWKVVDT